MNKDLVEDPQSGALGWLLEMELIQNPVVLNSMLLNIFKVIKGLKDAQFLIDSNDKKILIYLELTTWARWFNQEAITQRVNEMIDQVLPNFKKRVVYDKTILEKAMVLFNKR